MMNVAELKEKYFDNPEAFSFIYFFGKDSPFSNFYSTKIKVNGKVFYSNEQYFMWRKALYFNDNIYAERILIEGKDPKIAKRLGRKVRNYDDNMWREVREEIMYEGLKLKFTQNEELRKVLLGTGDKILTEASPFDKFWGSGIDKDMIKGFDNPLTWNGENKLGFLLVDLREELKGE